MKKNVSKLLSIFLALTLLISFALPTGAILALSESSAEDKIAYVNQSSGNDSTGAIDDAAMPYKSISEAIKKLDALSGDINRVIKIQGNYTVAGSTSGDYRGGQVNDNYTGFAAHTNPITITGEDGTANKLTFSAPLNRGLGGPIAIDNITYTATTRLHTLGHSLTIGESAVAVDSSGSDLYFGSLVGHNVDSSADQFTMIMNNGEFGRIIVGDADNTTTFSKPSKVVVNGGKLARVLIGQCYGTGTTTFNEDVNVILNGGTLTHANGVRLLAKSAFTNGATLQVIMNNGINYPFTNDPSSDNYYLIKVAANNGVTLDTTNVAGVYSVVGDLGNTVPVVKKDGVEVENAYDAATGKITVSAKGTYTVEWKEQVQGDQIAYVNQGSGNDSDAAIGNAEKPFKSINAAIKALDILEGNIDRIVKIQDAEYVVKGSTSGDYRNNTATNDYTGFANHTNPITIMGANGTANTLTFGHYLLRGLGGPITLDNITYKLPGDTRIYTLHNEFTIGSSAVGAESSGSDVYFGSHGAGYPTESDHEELLQEYKMTMNGGEFGRIIVGDAAIGTTFTKPVKVVVNNGTLARIMVGNGYGSSTTTFNENVNIILNGGTLTHANGVRLLAASAFTGDATMQVIMNNGINYPFTNSPNSENYYLIKVAANNGVTLDTTDVAGVYKVVGNIGDYVPVVKDASGNEVKNAYNSSSNEITVSAKGAYTVGWKGLVQDNRVAYVNQSSGNDSTGAIDNAAKPYKSISEAIKKLDALTGDINRIIKIQGNYTVKGSTSGDYRGGQVNDNYTGFAAHTNPITITGENGTANKLMFSAPLNRGLGGPIAIDNITYTVVGDTRLHTLGYSLTIGESAVAVDSSGSDLYFGSLVGHNVDLSADFTMIMNNGEFGRIIVGDADNTTTFSKPSKVVVNGGKLARILIGQCYGTGTTTFSANVNVVLNDVTLSHSNGVRVLSSTAFTNGATLQIIMNNGIAGKGNNKFTNSLATDNYYFIKVAENNGVTLDTTDVAGVYKIVGNGTPVVKNASGVEVQNAYDAETGTINVGAKGEYTVEWKVDKLSVNTLPDKTLYWVGENFVQTGLSLTLTRVDGSTETITEGFTVTGYNAQTTGEQTLTVTYGELTTTFVVKVRNQTETVTYFNFSGDKFDFEGFYSGVSTWQARTLYQANDFTTNSFDNYYITFDYYLPYETPIYVAVANNGLSFVDEASGESYLKQGYHTFKTALFTPRDFHAYGFTGNNLVPCFQTRYDYWTDLNSDDVVDGMADGVSMQPKDLYVWNMKLVNTNTGAVKENFTGNDPTREKGLGATTYSTAQLNLTTLEDTSNVYEIDFTTNPEYGEEGFTYGSYSVWMPVKRQLTAGTADKYTVSFDYFLPENNVDVYAYFDPNDYLNPDDSTWLRNVAEGENNDYKLEVGRHTFVANFTAEQLLRGNPSLRFQNNCGTITHLTKLYVWNVNFSCVDGSYKSEGNLVHGVPMVPSGSQVTVTPVSYADLETTVELDMYGAQVRDDNALRFIAAIKGASITRQSNGLALYDDTATIAIGGVTYKVTGAGVLFARDVKVAALGKMPEDAMSFAQDGRLPANVINISAEKLQKEEYHDTYLGQDVQGVVYTGVITNIPRANWSESLSARAYVKAVDENDNPIIFYGEVISRNLGDLIAATQPNNLNPNEKMHSTTEMDAAAEQFKTQNFGTDSVSYTGYSTEYYVDSVNGDDSRDGRTADTAWKTLDKVNTLNAGSLYNKILVRFKRGGEYRGQLQVKAYTTYAAYGEGERPVINASRMNYAKLPAYAFGAAVTTTGANGLYWQQLDPAKFENRWQLVGMGAYLNGLENNDTVGNNVGNMYFFDQNGDMIAYGSKSMDVAIYQDYEFYHQIDREIAAEGESNEGQILSLTVGDLFVYLPEGETPASYGKIEIAHNQAAILGEKNATMTNIGIHNLKVVYPGNHGISFNSQTSSKTVSNITISNCEIGWVGGSMLRFDNGTGNDYTDDNDVRLGNGIEFYGYCSNITVKNNWIYQCFDAGYSNQGGNHEATSVTVTNNLIEYCAYNIEIWMKNDGGEITNCKYENNFMRFAGYEFERDNRIGGSLTAISHVNFMSGIKPCYNVTVKNNVFDTSYGSMLVAAYPNSSSYRQGPTVSNNTWVQGYDHYSKLAYLYKNDNIADEQEHLSANDQADMTANISKKFTNNVVVDSNPTRVVFYK